jgi:hypothetical protein
VLKAISTFGALIASRSRMRIAIIGPSGCVIATKNRRSDVFGSKPRLSVHGFAHRSERRPHLRVDPVRRGSRQHPTRLPNEQLVMEQRAQSRQRVADG